MKKEEFDQALDQLKKLLVLAAHKSDQVDALRRESELRFGADEVSAQARDAVFCAGPLPACVVIILLSVRNGIIACQDCVRQINAIRRTSIIYKDSIPTGTKLLKTVLEMSHSAYPTTAVDRALKDHRPT